MSIRAVVVSVACLALLTGGTWAALVLRSASRDTRAILEGALRASGTPARDLSRRQLEILLRVEDPAFLSHHGLDFSTPGAGLTTVTQADVKVLYFEHFEPGLSKVRQSLIARFVLDRYASKADQLTIFINRAYLGTVDGTEIRGFDQAARVYFGVPFAALAEDQYIALVAMLIAPDDLSVIRARARNTERCRRIQRLLRGACSPAGWLDVRLDGCA